MTDMDKGDVMPVIEREIHAARCIAYSNSAEYALLKMVEHAPTSEARSKAEVALEALETARQAVLDAR